MKRTKSDEQEVENRLWKGMSCEDLRFYLENRRFGRQAISPGMLLLQLQYGAFEGAIIIEAIMQFDDEAIGEAIGVLLDRGLY